MTFEAIIPTVPYGNVKITANTADEFAQFAADAIRVDVFGVARELCALAALADGVQATPVTAPVQPAPARGSYTPPPNPNYQTNPAPAHQQVPPPDPWSPDPAAALTDRYTPQAATPTAPAAVAWPDAPACKHGPMTHRSGVTKSGPNQGKPWTGWFCPSPKGTPDQCEPDFNR